MRDVAILVDGGFYLKRYKKQIDVKQVAKGLLTHCLKHIHNQKKPKGLAKHLFNDFAYCFGLCMKLIILTY
jgi:hypothetical protein